MQSGLSAKFGSPYIQASGVELNLHNNTWNTNYPLWYPLISKDADFKATFTAKLLIETALVTSDNTYAL